MGDNFEEVVVGHRELNYEDGSVMDSLTTLAPCDYGGTYDVEVKVWLVCVVANRWSSIRKLTIY